MAKINSRIRQVREFLGLTQGDFAAKIGISRGYLSQIESEKKKPSIESLIGISTWFKIDDHWLLTGEGEMERKMGIDLSRVPRPYCTFVSNLAKIPSDLRREDFVIIPLVEGAIAAGEPIISEDKIEGWALIHVSQVGRRADLVAVRLHKKDGKSMEPIIRAGSMVAIDRGGRDLQEGKIYAVRTDWGCTIKYAKRAGDFLILIPANKDYNPDIIDLRGLEMDPIIGRVIWSWQTL